MFSRTTRLVITVLCPVVAVATASPAGATPPTTWPEPEPLSKLDAILIFVGIPAGLFVVIALLVMAPSVAKGPRYRPGLSWWANPEWFGGPAVEGESRPALESGRSERGGATAVTQVALTEADTSEGGASARW